MSLFIWISPAETRHYFLLSSCEILAVCWVNETVSCALEMSIRSVDRKTGMLLGQIEFNQSKILSKYYFNITLCISIIVSKKIIFKLWDEKMAHFPSGGFKLRTIHFKQAWIVLPRQNGSACVKAKIFSITLLCLFIAISIPTICKFALWEREKKGKAKDWWY